MENLNRLMRKFGLGKGHGLPASEGETQAATVSTNLAYKEVDHLNMNYFGREYVTQLFAVNIGDPISELRIVAQGKVVAVLRDDQNQPRIEQLELPHEEVRGLLESMKYTRLLQKIPSWPLTRSRFAHLFGGEEEEGWPEEEEWPVEGEEDRGGGQIEEEEESVEIPEGQEWPEEG